MAAGFSGRDTSIGAGRSAFRTTAWEALDALRAGDADPDALVAELSARYWRPCYRFVRTAWQLDNETAKDRTQAFFAHVFDADWLARADRSRGRFRTFLLASLKNFLRDAHKHDRAARRGGGLRREPLAAAAGVPSDDDPARAFERGWAEMLLADALAALREQLLASDRQRAWRIFEAYCLQHAGGRSYREVAAELGCAPHDVANDLFAARRALRRLLAARVGATVSDRDAVEEELRDVFA